MKTGGGEMTDALQGCLHHQKTPSPLCPPQGPSYSPTAGSYGQAFFYERGIPLGFGGGLQPKRSTPTLRLGGRRFHAKGAQLKRFQCLQPESQGQHIALTVLCVRYSLASKGTQHFYFGSEGFWFRVQGSGFGVYGPGCRVQGLGFRA